jgi:hypothetical protein
MLYRGPIKGFLAMYTSVTLKLPNLFYRIVFKGSMEVAVSSKVIIVSGKYNGHEVVIMPL